MYSLMQILFAVMSGYVLWVVVTKLWRYNALYQTVRNFANPAPVHWFWGHLNATFMTDMRPLINMSDTEVYRMHHNTKWAITWLGFLALIQANHPDSAKAVLKLSDHKPTGPGHLYNILTSFLGEGLINSNGAKWKRNRKMLTPAFHFDILRPYVRIYNEAADITLEKIARLMKESPKSIDITDVLNLATLDVILRCALSYQGRIQEQEKHPYATAVYRIGLLMIRRLMYPWHFLSWTLYMMSDDGKEYKRHLDYVHGFADDIIAKRRKAVADDPSLLDGKHRLDFLDILMTARDESGVGLTDQEIRDEVDTFMFAGNDTTSTALKWAIYNLGKYPDEQTKVYHEVCDVMGDRPTVEWEDLGKLQKLTLFMKESMRLFPPVTITSRVLSEPLQLDGVYFPTGTSVSVNFFYLHRHPDIYPDHSVFRPERFLPENMEDRDPYAFLPFSAGLRFRIMLDEDHEVIPLYELTFRSKNGIHIRFDER
ncbi:ultra-long-chain fatty acid omega-hydroxylase-like [Argopecten irradians]|uniref:ultra-long-chain fatty acid omega-hydroxylase-like n=1 Tax=Argopecten irradians TaxID=31199 RepID=UPI00371BE6DA